MDSILPKPPTLDMGWYYNVLPQIVDLPDIGGYYPDLHLFSIFDVSKSQVTFDLDLDGI